MPPPKLHDIMNIFSDPGDKGPVMPLPNVDELLKTPWLKDGMYYFPKTTDWDQQWDGMNRWWRKQMTDAKASWHYAGYTMNDELWDTKEPDFRNKLKALANVATHAGGAISTMYDRASSGTIAYQVNALELYLKKYVGDKGGTGLINEYYKLNLPDSAFQGTAAGHFGYRIFDLSLRLLDMADRLDELDQQITWMRDQIQPKMEALGQAVTNWMNNSNGYMKWLLDDWYFNTTSGTERWDANEDRFWIRVGAPGEIGSTDPTGTWGVPTDTVTTDNAHRVLNERWLKQLNPVIVAAEAAYTAMDTAYKESVAKISSEWEPLEGAPPITTMGPGGGDGEDGGGGDDNPFDGIFDNVFPDDMFDDIFPPDMFDDIFGGGDNTPPPLDYPDGFDTDGDGVPDSPTPPPAVTPPPPPSLDFPGGTDANGDGIPDTTSSPPPPATTPPPPLDLNGPGSVDTNGDGIPDTTVPPPATTPPPPLDLNGPGSVDTNGDGIPDSTVPPPLSEDPLGLNGPGGGDTTPPPAVVPPPPLPTNFGGGTGPGSNLNTPRSRQPLETDPDSGLPIDPETGEPFPVDPATGRPFDPDTGLPINFDPETGEVTPIDPVTGEPIDPATGPTDLEADPITGLPLNPETGEPFPVDPDTGVPYSPDTGLPINFDPATGEVLPIDPMTGESFDPDTGLPVSYDPATGEPLPLDPITGEPYVPDDPPALETDPETGLPLNPETGEPFPTDPETGMPYNPDTGLPINFDPATGEVYPVDPTTGEVINPETGEPFPVNPATGGQYNPDTGQPLNFGGGNGPDVPDLSRDFPEYEPPPVASVPPPPESLNYGSDSPGQSPGSSDRSSLFAGGPPPPRPDSIEPLPLNGPGSSPGGGSGGADLPGAGAGLGTGANLTGPGANLTGPGAGAGGAGGLSGGGLADGPGGAMNGMNGMNGMGTPMMPPMMGGMGGMGGGQDNRERQRTTWLSEDERVWGTNAAQNRTVLGRPVPGADKRSGARNEFVDAGGERTRTGSAAPDAARGGGRKRKPGAGNRGGRRQEQTGRGDGERER
ncbi:hypothetical protein ACFPZ0_21515 [Streptomonospora nanhaiensis]|uniref:hypothetical protein n=1 Tax=Streptomonospora nanhaiensis TaxID=1323731 RepID=UPI0027E0A783|nr:hypothetical protein [Streptomonospora nanhaiensis]